MGVPWTKDKLVILQWNANGILREVAALETFLESLQVDISCIQETKLLPNEKTPEFPHCRAVRRDRPIQVYARGGGLIIYVRVTLAFFAIYPTAGTSNVLEKLTVAIQLPGQRIILVNYWYLPLETSNFLQWVGFSDSEFQTKLQQFEIISVDLNDHNPPWHPVA